MELVAAQMLTRDMIVYDADGKPFTFIELDARDNLVVKCRSGINGRITLDRATCSRNKNPRKYILPRKRSEYNCDFCDEHVPNGSGMYLGNAGDDRVCEECYTMIKADRVDN